MTSGDHSIRKYDEELEAMRSRVLQMGGLVESQVRTALVAFETIDLQLAQQAIDADRRVNDAEIDLDQMVNHDRAPPADGRRSYLGIAAITTSSASATKRARSHAR
jgi:phosphate transport system protein